MHVPSGTELLDLWETRAHEPPARRALELAAAAGAEDPSRLTAGQRDIRLLGLRAAMFGERLDAIASCPACEAPVELSAPVADLVASGAESPPAAELHRLRWRGWQVSFRLPTAGDLAAASVARDLGEARRILLERCVSGAVRGGNAVPAAHLPAALVDRMGRRIEELDAAAELRLALECPSCGHAWEESLDVAALVWAEFDAAARRLLDDVDVLARAYGWSEPDVLALSPARRRAYLELAG